jgi:predicted ATPase
MIGREEDLAVLTDALDRATRSRTCRLVTVVAPAGTGKSRLLRELIERSGVTAIQGRCLSYGEGLTFWPLAEMARGAAGIANDDTAAVALEKLMALLGEEARDVVERIAGAIGLSPATYPVEETFWAARRFFEIMGNGRPLLVLIDDIHWAERTFLDLIRFVVASERGVPILIACSARRELFDSNAWWGEDIGGHEVFTLEPLSDKESGQVAANLLGTTGLDDEVRSGSCTRRRATPCSSSRCSRCF